MIDHEDWGVSFSFFHFIDEMWGSHTIDRFASHPRRTFRRLGIVPHLMKYIMIYINSVSPTGDITGI
jgi:hypothetical protein